MKPKNNIIYKIVIWIRFFINKHSISKRCFFSSRDIKSSNIMLVADTWIKLIDFGMAKRLYVKDMGFSTSTSTMVGTVKI
jgi:serine/threonine protein kinase